VQVAIVSDTHVLHAGDFDSPGALADRTTMLTAEASDGDLDVTVHEC